MKISEVDLMAYAILSQKVWNLLLKSRIKEYLFDETILWTYSINEALKQTKNKEESDYIANQLLESKNNIEFLEKTGIKDVSSKMMTDEYIKIGKILKSIAKRCDIDIFRGKLKPINCKIVLEEE